jgi:hypothetical protein
VRGGGGSLRRMSSPHPHSSSPAHAGDPVRRGPSIPSMTSRPSLRATGSRECAPDDRLREAIHRATKRRNGLLRRFAPRNDGCNCRHTFAIPRRDSPGVYMYLRALMIRGRGECRMRAAPAVSCAKCTKENAHEHTGSAEAIRHSLRNGFTAYSALSPATNSFCHRHRRISGFARPGRVCENLRRFSTSNGCQDHTTSPYASAPFVWYAVSSLTCPKNPPCDDDRARRCRVHRIPPRVNDDRETPLFGPGRRGL